MNGIRSGCFSIFLFLLSSSLSYAGPVIGETAPDFELPDIRGTPHRLSDYQRKYVVLEWFNYDCPFVAKHYGSRNMQALQKAFTEKNVVWLSIFNSSAPGKQGHDSPEEFDRLARERDAAPTAIFSDPDGTVGHLYEAETTPQMFVIDPKGRLIYKGAIDDKPSTDPADMASATNYVKQVLEESMAGRGVTTPATKSYGCSVKY